MTRRVSIPFVLALLGLLGDAAGTPYLGASPAWATVCFVYDGDAFHTYRETAVGSSPIAPGSAPESLFADAGLGVCSDLADNDGDGLTDAADAGCANSDGDSISGMPIDDAMETILGSSPASAASTPEHWLYDAIVFTVPVRCVDGLDNDGDGLTDAADPDCTPDVDLDGIPPGADTEGPSPNASGLLGVDDCADWVDNDGDGLVDTAEPGCANADGDLLTDLCDGEGPNSNSNGVGGLDDCSDAVDNDGDGLTDLAEPQCLTCGGVPATIIGTPGNDVLKGTPGNDSILGLGGNDRIFGLDGDDSLCGGPGRDRLDAGNGNDHVYGGDGNDVLLGRAGFDILFGGAGSDGISGGDDNDWCFAASGFSPPVTEKINGDDGDDLLSVEGAAEGVVSGGAGNDEIIGSDGDDRLSGGAGDDVIGGNAGADRISAGPGNDVAEGGPGNDQIRGGTGDDTLYGHEGADTLLGDLGTDSCDGGNGLDVAASSCETVLDVP